VNDIGMMNLKIIAFPIAVVDAIDICL